MKGNLSPKIVLVPLTACALLIAGCEPDIQQIDGRYCASTGQQRTVLKFDANGSVRYQIKFGKLEEAFNCSYTRNGQRITIDCPDGSPFSVVLKSRKIVDAEGREYFLSNTSEGGNDGC